jgi:SOS regulatory protein LexA
MLEAMHKRDVAYLGRLQSYYSEHGALPSYARLSEVLGFRSKTSAVKLASRLKTAGYVQPAPGGKLAPTQQFLGLPLVASSVRAGQPELPGADGSLTRTSIDSLLVDNPEDSVLVPISGESMRDAGILDGDIAVVNRRAKARNGDFVIAIVDGAFTLKQLFLRDGKVKLMPKNDDFKPIEPVNELEIYGVVSGLIRKFHHRKTR